MKRFAYYIVLMVITMFTSCEVDNYPEPDAALSGTVIDNYTHKPFVTEQPNGFQIRCEQQEYSEKADNNPVTFWGRADGTFTHTKLFAGKYKIVLANGAFVCDETPIVKIESHKTTTQEFTVTPYLGFNSFSVTKEGNTTVKITFVVHKCIPNTNPQDYFVHLQPVSSSLTPLVGNNDGTYDKNISVNNQSLTEIMLDKPIEVLIPVTAGKQYYVRVGARCVGVPAGRYNMTEILKIDM